MSVLNQCWLHRRQEADSWDLHDRLHSRSVSLNSVNFAKRMLTDLQAHRLHHAHQQPE